MDNSWRASLAHDTRQSMDTLQRHRPVSGQDGVDELLKTAWRFEEKIFKAATDPQNYLRKISLKMLSLETKYNREQAAAQAALKPVDPAAMAMRNESQASS